MLVHNILKYYLQIAKDYYMIFGSSNNYNGSKCIKLVGNSNTVYITARKSRSRLGDVYFLY